MGTQSSDLRLILRKSHRIERPTPTMPTNPCQCADAERDIADGGGTGFLLFLLITGVMALGWWLI